MKSPVLSLALMFACCALAPAAAAQVAIQSGTYLSADMRVSIRIEATSGGLVIVEPNQRSMYDRVGPNDYRYTSSRGIEYGVRVLSATEIETYRPGRNGPGTGAPGSRFTLRPDPVMRDSSDDHFEELAEAYLERAENDSSDVLLWTTCAVLAHGRASFDAASFPDFAAQSVANLKMVMEPGAANPCPDVIPASMW